MSWERCEARRAIIAAELVDQSQKIWSRRWCGPLQVTKMIAHNAPIITALARIFHGVEREDAPFAHPSATKTSQSGSVTPL